MTAHLRIATDPADFRSLLQAPEGPAIFPVDCVFVEARRANELYYARMLFKIDDGFLRI